MTISGEGQIKRFIKAYQNIERIEEIENSSQDSVENKDPIIQYLKNAHKNKMPPHKVAFKNKVMSKEEQVSTEVEPDDIVYNLKAININNQFAQAFAENLKVNQHLNYLILQGNKLNDKTFIELIKSFPSQIKKLDISHNPGLTIKSYKMLYSKLSTILPELSHLILEGNEIGDESCRIICQLCTKLYHHLAVLNLSKCSITDVGAEYVANLLKLQGSKIKALLLHWNKIMGRGAGLIARALEENSVLRIFDASFNSFGSSPLYVKTR